MNTIKRCLTKIKRQIKIWKIKWLLGACHKMCKFCAFRYDCHPHFDYEEGYKN